MRRNVHRQVVVVSGGGTGIGAATAHRFAQDGADVVLLGRRREPLGAVAAGIGAWAIPCDTSDRAQVDQAVSRVVERYGRLDAVIANAGGHGVGAVAETDDSQWELSFRTNVSTAFMLARAALPELVESRGNIVVVSSLAGLFAGPGVAGYTVGKHALLGLTRSLARDYGRKGVRVNAVCPGWVRTPMADEEMDVFASETGLPGREEGYAVVTRDVPLGRAAAPGEIASVIRFLASPDASYITGSTLVVDGGAHIVDLPTVSMS